MPSDQVTSDMCRSSCIPRESNVSVVWLSGGTGRTSKTGVGNVDSVEVVHQQHGGDHGKKLPIELSHEFLLKSSAVLRTHILDEVISLKNLIALRRILFVFDIAFGVERTGF